MRASTRTRTTILGLPLVLFVVSGAAAGGAPEVRTDEDIKGDVVDQLAANDLVNASGIKVDVEMGEVTLTGSVPSYSTRQEAAAETWSVEGVISVDNQLEVLYQGATLGDDFIQRHIKNLLRMSAGVEIEQLEVDVDEGMVTLDGRAQSHWEKIRAENIASDVDGVVGVNNAITVVPTEDVVDRAVAEDIRAALRRKTAVNEDNVDVRVQDGVVTLSGTVSTWNARNAAYEAASNTLGVIEVVDNLVVETVLTEVPSDAELRDEVADNLEWDTRVDEEDIVVLVDDRKVTLTGTVDSYTEKQHAEADAWTVPGVRSVENELTVVGEIADTDDGYVKAAVEDALATDANIEDEGIEVKVEAGLVTLEGTVPTLWQKTRAEQTASDVVGVVGIENKLAAVPTEDILDETIAENITFTIDRKAAVDVEDVNVKVVDGTVTLSGTVPSKAAHDAAYKAALYAYGVTEIKDELEVRKIGSSRGGA